MTTRRKVLGTRRTGMAAGARVFGEGRRPAGG